MRSVLLIAMLVALLGTAAWFEFYSWAAITGPPVPADGHPAMWIGTAFALAVGCGLLALVMHARR